MAARHGALTAGDALEAARAVIHPPGVELSAILSPRCGPTAAAKPASSVVVPLEGLVIPASAVIESTGGDLNLAALEPLEEEPDSHKGDWRGSDITGHDIQDMVAEGYLPCDRGARLAGGAGRRGDTFSQSWRKGVPQRPTGTRRLPAHL